MNVRQSPQYVSSFAAYVTDDIAFKQFSYSCTLVIKILGMCTIF